MPCKEDAHIHCFDKELLFREAGFNEHIAIDKHCWEVFSAALLHEVITAVAL